MRVESVYCKKTYNHYGYNFIKGSWYNAEYIKTNDVFVYDDDDDDGGKWFIGSKILTIQNNSFLQLPYTINNLFHDYFYTEKELRLLKLKKLNYLDSF